MKQLVLFLGCSFIALSNLKAQSSFSCVEREYCYWNDTIKDFDNCSGYEDNSLFVMNASETMFTHTTESLKSSYYVQSKEYDEKNDVYRYKVVSDVGNEYIYIFDPKNKQIRALFVKDGETILLTFTVKASF